MSTVFDDALLQMARITGSDVSAFPNTLPRNERLASALGWGLGPAHVDPVRKEADSLRFAQGYFGSQKATLFATDGAHATGTRFQDAALFAYHSSIHWGVIADEDAAVVFNSHWLKGDDWLRVREIPWVDIDQHRVLVKALTPAGVTTGDLDRVAAQIAMPDRILKPVDDELVERLDHWRQQALRFGHESSQLDDDLHTLFAQLFVLRAVEDRMLSPNIPSLESVVLRSSVDLEKLRVLFVQARQHIQSDLFSTDPYRHFPDFILAGIVQDLYHPSHLPQSDSRYNFAWIDADILGRAYEKYLATVFAYALPSPQLRLFDQPLRDLEPVSVKRSAGVFYTPQHLVSTLTQQSISECFAAQADPGFIPTVADFACGSGSFLVSAVDILLRHLRERDPRTNWARTLIEGQHVIGIDIDPRAVERTKLNLWIRFTDEPEALPLPSFDRCIVEGDSLGAEVWTMVPTQYDVIVGNPPFIATGRVQSREELSRRFSTARGRFDYSYLFLELAIDRLMPEGTLGMVVPNRLFRNRDAGPIRSLIASATDVLAVIDFGSAEVFDRTSAYIGAIVARKRPPGVVDRRSNTRAVLVSNVSDTRYLSGVILNALAEERQITDGVVTAFQTALAPAGRPWVILSPGALRHRMLLENDSVELSEIAGVFQGIRTGANDVFIVTLESTDGGVASITDALGGSSVVELSLLHPVVFGADIQRYEPLLTDRMLIYPYRNGAAISEAQLRDQFPLTYAYLSHYREQLSSRSSIISSGLNWYEIVRKRDERWLSSKKLLTRDLATQTSFTLDESGRLFLVGGTAVTPMEEELTLPLLAYLNSSVANSYLSEVTPAFRGSFQKFEPQHLSRLPVPRFIVEGTDEAFELGALANQVLSVHFSSRKVDVRALDDEIDRLITANTGVTS